MIFEVVLSRAVVKTLDSLDPSTQKRIRNRIKQIAIDPFDHHISKSLTHAEGSRSSRVGGWRIIYLVDAEKALVDILTIATRGQVYRRL